METPYNPQEIERKKENRKILAIGLLGLAAVVYPLLGPVHDRWERIKKEYPAPIEHHYQQHNNPIRSKAEEIYRQTHNHIYHKDETNRRIDKKNIDYCPLPDRYQK